MGLVTKIVNVKWSKSRKKYYTELGYVFTDYGDEFKVKVEDLSKGSNIKIKYICDECNKLINTDYNSYNKNIKENNKSYCQKCSCKLFGSSKIKESNLKKSKSFEQWCIENNRQDVLDRWDYELNNCKPSEITYGSRKYKYWFKCDKNHKHKSELKCISGFTGGQEGSICCTQCNSIAQWILDNFPDKKLENVWDHEKNGNLNPWKVSCGSRRNIWVKCQDTDYHESYSTKVYVFTKGHKCPYCFHKNGKVHPKDSLGQYVIDNFGEEFLWDLWSVKNKKSPFEYSYGSKKQVWWKCLDDKHEDYKREIQPSTVSDYRCPQCSKIRTESILEEKTRLYLESLGYTILHEYNCTITPKNPKSNHMLPFDNEIKELKLIIEVHGSQHYEEHFFEYTFKCPKEDAIKRLHKRKIIDRYKKVYVIQNGYYYLEIPYTAFDSKDTYKKLIDDKIKEVLNKNY